MQVIDVMTTRVHAVRPETSLKEAARTMARHGLSGLPVVEGQARVVGVVSEADLLVREAERGEARPGLSILRPELWPEDRSPERVGEVMSTPALTTRPDVPLTEVARLMVRLGVKRLPVVDEAGRLVGIVSRGDVVAAFSRPDELIEDQIREDVVRRHMGLDPGRLAVEVDEGVVSLGGQVPLRSDARLLDELVRRLEGVVRVESRLTWVEDDLPSHTSTGMGDDPD